MYKHFFKRFFDFWVALFFCAAEFATLDSNCYLASLC